MPRNYESTAKQNAPRIGGTDTGYYLWSLIWASSFFFLFYILAGFTRPYESINVLVTSEFWYTFLILALMALITDYLGRLAAYLTLRAIANWRGRAMRSVWDLNKKAGWKSIWYHLAEVGIRAFLFLVGAIGIIQRLLFGDNTILSLCITYVLIKIGIYALLRAILGPVI